MVKMNTLIIDDDKLWQKSISKFVQMNPSLNLVGMCSSAMEAYAIMIEKEIDLIVCDIEMPEMSGIDFIKNIKNPPLVIFVTSHRDFALDCYDVSPVDFMLKPLDVPRFFLSIEKAKQRFVSPTETLTVKPYLFIRENNTYVQLAYSEIEYMESEDNFLKIITPTQTYMPILTISKMEQGLKGDVFMRVHRSYLVNREAIAKIAKNDIILHSGKTIPIGDQYRNQLNRKHIESNLISRNN